MQRTYQEVQRSSIRTSHQRINPITSRKHSRSNLTTRSKPSSRSSGLVESQLWNVHLKPSRRRELLLLLLFVAAEFGSERCVRGVIDWPEVLQRHQHTHAANLVNEQEQQMRHSA